MEYTLVVKQIEMIDREIEELSDKKKRLRDILAGEGLATGDGKTHWQMAEIVLDKEKKPLHAKEVQRRIEEEFKVRVDFKSLSQVLYAKSKARKYFFKDRKMENTYGLLKWAQ